MSAGYNVVPTSAELGGCEKRDSGLRVGYAHTAAGALIAATTYSVALDPASAEGEADAEAAMVAGADRDELIEQGERIRDGEAPAADMSLMRSAELVGYDVRDVTDDRASFGLHYDFDDDAGLRQQAVIQIDVVWQDGDWKAEPASGQQGATAELATDDPAVDWGP